MMRGSLSRPKKMRDSSLSPGLARKVAASGSARNPRASPTYGTSPKAAILDAAPSAVELTGTLSARSCRTDNGGTGAAGAASAAGGALALALGLLLGVTARSTD